MIKQKDLAIELTYYMLDPLQMMVWDYKKLDKYTEFKNIHTVFKSTVYFYKSITVNILMLLPGMKVDNKQVVHYFISSAKCHKIDKIINKYKKAYPYATFSNEIMCVHMFNNFFLFKEGQGKCLLSTLDNIKDIDEYAIDASGNVFFHNGTYNKMINDFRLWCDSLNVIQRMSS